MDGSTTVKILGERLVFSGRTISVFERDIELGAGKTVTWEVLRRDDSVAIVPLDRGGNVYLVEQFHGAVNYWGLTLPKGSIEGGDTPAEAARKELNEETELEGDLKELTTFTVSPGFLTQKTIVFLAENVRPAAELRPKDEEELLKVVCLPLDAAIDRVLNAEFAEARTVAGLLLAREFMRNR
jgi:8-oxo-dGTP pyrophosphatase MutT (NUDIX family)